MPAHSEINIVLQRSMVFSLVLCASKESLPLPHWARTGSGLPPLPLGSVSGWGWMGVARSLFLIPCVVSPGLLDWQQGPVSPPTTRRPQCPWVRPLLLHKCIHFPIVP